MGHEGKEVCDWIETKKQSMVNAEPEEKGNVFWWKLIVVYTGKRREGTQWTEWREKSFGVWFIKAWRFVLFCLKEMLYAMVWCGIWPYGTPRRQTLFSF